MVVTFVVIMIRTFRLIAILVVIVMTSVAFMKDFRVLPVVALTGNSSEEKTSGEQVKSFHLRRV